MQIGILSKVDLGCQNILSIPDIYISVGHFRDWIDQIVATA